MLGVAQCFCGRFLISNLLVPCFLRFYCKIYEDTSRRPEGEEGAVSLCFSIIPAHGSDGFPEYPARREISRSSSPYLCSQLCLSQYVNLRDSMKRKLHDLMAEKILLGTFLYCYSLNITYRLKYNFYKQAHSFIRNVKRIL